MPPKVIPEFKALFIAGTVLLMTSCSTGYQSSNSWKLNGGYSETQLSEDVYKVSFRGNGYTSLEKASDFALMRAAEIGLEKGYTHFAIINADEGFMSDHRAPDYACSAFGVDINCRPSGGGTINKPRAANMVKYFKSKPANFNGTLYKAQFLFDSLSQKYGVTRTAP